LQEGRTGRSPREKSRRRTIAKCCLHRVTASALLFLR
jgi:hypothetical protein